MRTASPSADLLRGHGASKGWMGRGARAHRARVRAATVRPLARTGCAAAPQGRMRYRATATNALGQRARSAVVGLSVFASWSSLCSGSCEGVCLRHHVEAEETSKHSMTFTVNKAIAKQSNV